MVFTETDLMGAINVKEKRREKKMCRPHRTTVRNLAPRPIYAPTECVSHKVPSLIQISLVKKKTRFVPIRYQNIL